MKIEERIVLDKFKPRPYQMPFVEAFETKKYRKFLCIWPRRCLYGKTHVIMANGSFKFLKDIEIGDSILSWNGEKFVADTVKNKWITEIKETVTLRAKSGGLPLVGSADHVIAYSHCSDDTVLWKKIGDLTKYNNVNIYGGLRNGSVENHDLAEFYGYLLSDGYVSYYQQPKFTNNNIEILKRVEELAISLFGCKTIWRPKGNGFDLGFSNGTKGGGTFTNPVKELLRKDSLDIPKSQRFLPPILWEMNRTSILRFFAALISCDGNIYCHKNGFHSNYNGHDIPPAIEITISCGPSYNYGWGIYWLLRKFGFQPQVPYCERGSNWKIKLAKCHDIRDLFSFNIIYGKTEAAQKALSLAKTSKPRRKIIAGCYRSQCTVIEGEQSVLYDIETKQNHNFIANGYLVHNSGKDLTSWNLMVAAALEKCAIYYYLLPTYNQCKKVVWDGQVTIDGQSMKFLDFIPRSLIASINQTEQKIILVNGSLIQLVGSTEYDRIMGTNPYGICMSEYSLSDPDSLAYLRPILLANGGWLMVNSTPRGHNALWNLFSVASNSPDWFVSKLTLDDTKHISAHEIQKEIANNEISEDLAKQEYWCSFDMGTSGSFYGNLISKMRQESRICAVPYEPNFPAFSSWDIGLDATAIIIGQLIGNSCHIIDYYENSNLSLQHYIEVLKNMPYIIETNIFPHDIANREFTSGVSRIDTLKNFNIDVTIARNISIEDGIEQVRILLGGKCWIDERKCQRLIKCLENYRQQFDEKKQMYTGKHVHDAFSHGADSLRMLAITLPRLSRDTSADELEARYRAAVLGENEKLPSIFRNDLPPY